MVLRPQANLYFNVGDNNTIKGILDSAGIPAGTQDDIIAALEASGGNILNLPQIVTDQFGLSSSGLIMPNQKNLENDIVYLIQQGYSYLPEFLGYNLLPVISIGFTIFPF